MTARTVRLRAVLALGLAGLLVLHALLVLPPAAAATGAFLVALATTLPGTTGAGPRPATTPRMV